MKRLRHKTNRAPKQYGPTRFYHNFRLTMLLILLPLTVGALAIYYALSGPLAVQLASFGSKRLVTDNWQIAYTQLSGTQPEYGPKNAYYRLKVGQDLDWVAQHFSIDAVRLQEINPGLVTYNTTVAIPPVEKPLQPFGVTSGNVYNLTVREVDGTLRLSNDFRNPKVRTTIPEMTQFLAYYGAISKIADKHYRINRPISIEKNIRLDITGSTVNKLELSSGPNFAITCLCAESAEILIKDTAITSVDPTTNQPDTKQEDGRSFIRGLNSTRLDIINSDISYLGSGLNSQQSQKAILRNGGMYGTAWRINDDKLGQEIATGWVEGSTFHNNYYGAYSFGASGMMWRNNLFNQNEVYGLDPHDDSNSAIIENNRFIKNGKHGFIVSKRCNFNIIRNNISVDNGLHGFMLHQDSNYNLIENNMAIGNTDNFVIFNSSFNTISANKSYVPRSSHVRSNFKAKQNYITDNLFYGGKQGISLYEGVDGALVEQNVFNKISDNILNTSQAGRVLLTNNTVDSLHYRIAEADRVVFGPNRVETKPALDMSPLQVYYY
ncbi:right-handed parallel beta-helix repeat-containing protein [Candidatus Saccharibacteria bacterium]|nr:right-handed parallel beta-helix repeat-containing protein [Candidatus Saccharibacteria bacterium]